MKYLTLLLLMCLACPCPPAPQPTPLPDSTITLDATGDDGTAGEWVLTFDGALIGSTPSQGVAQWFVPGTTYTDVLATASATSETAALTGPLDLTNDRILLIQPGTPGWVLIAQP